MKSLFRKTVILLLLCSAISGCKSENANRYPEMQFSALGGSYDAYQEFFLFGPIYNTFVLDESDDISLISVLVLKSRDEQPVISSELRFHLIVFNLKKSEVRSGTITLTESNTFLFYRFPSDRKKEMNLISVTSGEMTISEYNRSIIVGSFVIEGYIKDDRLSVPVSIENGSFSIPYKSNIRYTGFNLLTNSMTQLSTDSFLQKCEEYDSSKHYQDCWWYGYCDESCQCLEIKDYCQCRNNECIDTQ